MTAVTLILVAPCSLLLGAILQLLVARLCSAKAKGILAVLFCLPSLLAVIATAPHVFAGQAIDFTVRQWNLPSTIAIHVDALSVLFALMVRRDRRVRAGLLRQLHGAREVRYAFLRDDADLYRGLRRAGV